MNDPPQDNDAAIGDVPEPTNISDDPPSMFVNAVDVPSPVAHDEVSEEILLEDNNTATSVILIHTSLNIFQKPSSSKARFHLGLSSSS